MSLQDPEVPQIVHSSDDDSDADGSSENSDNGDWVGSTTELQMLSASESEEDRDEDADGKFYLVISYTESDDSYQRAFPTRWAAASISAREVARLVASDDHHMHETNPIVSIYQYVALNAPNVVPAFPAADTSSAARQPSDASQVGGQMIALDLDRDAFNLQDSSEEKPLRVVLYVHRERACCHVDTSTISLDHVGSSSPLRLESIGGTAVTALRYWDAHCRGFRRVAEHGIIPCMWGGVKLLLEHRIHNSPVDTLQSPTTTAPSPVSARRTDSTGSTGVGVGVGGSPSLRRGSASAAPAFASTVAQSKSPPLSAAAAPLSMSPRLGATPPNRRTPPTAAGAASRPLFSTSPPGELQLPRRAVDSSSCAIIAQSASDAGTSGTSPGKQALKPALLPAGTQQRGLLPRSSSTQSPPTSVPPSPRDRAPAKKRVTFKDTPDFMATVEVAAGSVLKPRKAMKATKSQSSASFSPFVNPVEIGRAKVSSPDASSLNTVDKSWESLDIPVSRAQVSTKLRDRIRRGIPNRYRRLMWRMLTDSATLLESDPKFYDHALRRLATNRNRYQPDPDSTDFSPQKFPLFGGTEMLQNGAPLNSEGIRLGRIMLCLVREHDPEIQFCPGLPMLTHMLLLFMPPAEVYSSIQCMLQEAKPTEDAVRQKKHKGTGHIWWVTQNRVQYAILCQTFRALVRKLQPEVGEHLESIGFVYDDIVSAYFDRFFMNVFPVFVVLRIADAFLNEGVKILYRFSIAYLAQLKDSILRMRSRGAVSALLTNPQMRTDWDPLFKCAYGLQMSRRDFDNPQFFVPPPAQASSAATLPAAGNQKLATLTTLPSALKTPSTVSQPQSAATTQLGGAARRASTDATGGAQPPQPGGAARRSSNDAATGGAQPNRIAAAVVSRSASSSVDISPVSVRKLVKPVEAPAPLPSGIEVLHQSLAFALIDRAEGLEKRSPAFVAQLAKHLEVSEPSQLGFSLVSRMSGSETDIITLAVKIGSIVPNSIGQIVLISCLVRDRASLSTQLCCGAPVQGRYCPECGAANNSYKRVLPPPPDIYQEIMGDQDTESTVMEVYVAILDAPSPEPVTKSICGSFRAYPGDLRLVIPGADLSAVSLSDTSLSLSSGQLQLTSREAPLSQHVSVVIPCSSLTGDDVSSLGLVRDVLAVEVG